MFPAMLRLLLLAGVVALQVPALARGQVPAHDVTPASHGCVRVPIWEADWLYNQSPVGERVNVYE